MSLPGRILDIRRADGTWKGHAHEQWGDVCIDCRAPADLVVQGETDSFGYEANALCKACHKREEAIPIIGQCAWCGVEEEPLYPARDYDEGLHGPVYYVCSGCKP